MIEPGTAPGSVRFGEDFELDFSTYELRRSGRLLKLERIPKEILLLLVARRGEVATREQIVEKIWGKNVFLDTDNSINGAIRKIRQVLRDDSEQPRFIQTIAGTGYRFVAPVLDLYPKTQAAEPAPTPAPTQAPPILAENILGKKISHYRVIQLLGGGGMGLVYKAEDLKLGRLVALKFLPIELARDPQALERLQREARAASALEHPNICSIYQLGEHDGQPFIVMQLLDGQTLRDWIGAEVAQGTTPRVERLVDLAVQIVDGLATAHSRGFIHRDIKPANIFITQSGQAKILDFGVAKFVGAAGDVSGPIDTAIAGVATNLAETPVGFDPQVSRSGDTVGTPSYLSPEQIRHQPLDARTDLFSFGLVLYEMATGQRAFSGSTATGIRNAVINLDVEPARQLMPDLPNQLDRIIGKCLKKDRELRYQSAEELRADLIRFKAGLRPVSSRLRWIGVWAAACTVIFLLSWLGMNARAVRERFFKHPSAESVGSTLPFETRPSVAVLGFKNLSGRDDEVWISTALSEMLGAELAAGEELRIVPSEDVARMKLDLALPDAPSYSRDTLGRVRNHLSADMVVLGSYLAQGKDAGGKVRIDLQLQDTQRGETIAVISREGLESNLTDLVSQGGARLRQKLRIGDVSSSDALEVRAILPENPEAARLYSEGLAKLEGFDALAAKELFEKAIRVDPNHALSHSALADAWSGLGYDAKAKAEAKKASDLSATLPREQRLFVDGRYREFARDLPAAIEVYRTLRNYFPDNLIYGLRLAAVQTRAGLGKEALQTIDRMRQLRKPASDDPRIDIQEAAAAQLMGDFKREQQSAAGAATKAEARGARLVMAEAKAREAWAWDRLGDLDRAAKEMYEVRDLAASAGNPWLTASALRGIGVVLYNQGNFAEARKFYSEALDLFRKTGAQRHVSAVLTDLGNILYDQGKMLEARKYYEDGLKVDREVDNAAGVASDLGDIANVLDGLGDLVGATGMHEQSLQAFRGVGDKRGEASTLNNLGQVYLERGQVSSAQQSLDQALAIQKEIGYQRGRGFSLTLVAQVLFQQGRLDEAKTTIEQAIALRKEQKDESNVARSQIWLAEILLELQNPAEAESLARAAAAVFEQNKVADAGAFSEATLAKALLAQKKWKEAKAAADRALALSQQTTDRPSRFSVALAAAEVDAASGRVAEATKALENTHVEARLHGYFEYELQSQLQLAQIEIQVGHSAIGRARLHQMQEEARNKGFLLISHKAAAAAI